MLDLGKVLQRGVAECPFPHFCLRASTGSRTFGETGCARPFRENQLRPTLRRSTRQIGEKMVPQSSSGVVHSVLDRFRGGFKPRFCTRTSETQPRGVTVSTQLFIFACKVQVLSEATCRGIMQNGGASLRKRTGSDAVHEGNTPSHVAAAQASIHFTCATT